MKKSEEIERLKIFFKMLLEIKNALLNQHHLRAAYLLGAVSILTEKSIELLEEKNGTSKRKTEESEKSYEGDERGEVA